MNSDRNDTIERSFSVWLDVIRFGAAMFVFLSHVCQGGMADAILPDIKRYGRDAVTVFFVLSGFVISYTAATRDATWFDFMIARLARLWSVCIPALLVAALLSHLGGAIDPHLYQSEIAGDMAGGFDGVLATVTAHPWLRLVAGALFLNEPWTLTIIAYDNPPYWSLAYGFCYYLLFASGFYLTGWTRILSAAAIALVYGPKILLLLPIWLMGVALYRLRPRVPAGLAWPCVIVPVVALLAGNYLELRRYAWWFDARLPFEPNWSTHFVWQYAVGVLVCVHLMGFRCLANAGWILRAERPIRWLAARTLSLYLFHFPLIYFFGALMPLPAHPVARGFLVIGATLLSVVLLASVTELRKSQWRRGLLAVAGAIGALSGRGPRWRGAR